MRFKLLTKPNGMLKFHPMEEGNRLPETNTRFHIYPTDSPGAEAPNEASMGDRNPWGEYILTTIFFISIMTLFAMI